MSRIAMAILDRHGDKVDLHRGQGCRVVVDPAHTIGVRLGSREIERAARRFDTSHLQAAASEKQRERACPAAHLQHTTSAQLVSDADIHIKVTAVEVECVIDRDQPGVLEDLVSYAVDHKPANRRYSIPGCRSRYEHLAARGPS